MAVIGIDLGTTNCCVAIADKGEAVVISNAEGSRTTPSVVAVTEDGNRLVGDFARRQAITNARNTVTCIKRVLGRPYDCDEVKAVRERSAFELSRNPGGKLVIGLGDSKHSPEEISAMLLAKLRQAAEDYLGEEIMDAVVTVPAYFDDRQRRATRDAARIAGLNVLRMLNEPTAAALSYGMRETEKDTETVAIYDLGGGTFDITVLEIGDGIYHVRATNGDCFLGGEDFNERVVAWLEKAFEEQTGIQVDAANDPVVRQRLYDAAERAKIALSTSFEAPITVPFLAVDDSGPLHLECTLHRSTYEELVHDLVERTIERSAECLKAGGLKPDEVDTLILVGGQTRMPLIRTKVRDFFGKVPLRATNPDEAVAVGAALQAAVLEGGLEDQLLLDVVPLSLGIETSGGVMTRLIERNTSIPTKASQIFTTTRDDQDLVRVHVLQGEREMSIDNRSLGIFELYGIPAGPKGSARIEVSFEVDQDGILNVSASEKSTGRTQRVRIVSSGNLSGGEIDQMRKDAEAHRKADLEKRERVELQNELGMIIHRCRQKLSKGDFATDPNACTRISEIVVELERSRTDNGSRLDALRNQRDEAKAALASFAIS